MNGLDAIEFTAGVGKNTSLLRKLVCTDMEYFGLQLDDSKNRSRSDSLREINRDGANVKILVIPTDEELEMAKQVFGLVQRP